MTDRELLELAAKAAGYGEPWTLPEYDAIYIGPKYKPGYPVEYKPWNPLTDDGDALRLAVKLGLLVDCASHCARPLPDSIEWQEGSGPDGCANTRRAIVRAAAEIGKSM